VKLSVVKRGFHAKNVGLSYFRWFSSTKRRKVAIVDNDTRYVSEFRRSGGLLSELFKVVSLTSNKGTCVRQ
jgi:hypothetical protein